MSNPLLALDADQQGYAGLALIVGVGLATGVFAVSHVTTTTIRPGDAVYVLTPIVVSIGLVGTGAFLWRERFDGVGMLRIAGWMFVGMIVFGLLITWTITHEAIRGNSMAYGLFVTTNSVAIGGFVGLMLGWLDARTRQYQQELERKQERLQAQVNQLDEFASIVSHDLRNPLNVARGQLDLAQMECDSEHLDEIAVSHDRMDALIEDLLTMARDGNTAIEPEPVELADLLDDCWKTVQTPEAALVVETDQTVTADRSRLQQLFENLIRNATDHGPNDVTVTVGPLDDGFYVEDDGPGIPEEHRTELFDSGFTTAETGTGLGLSIVRQIVEAHGWSIRATNGADGGARFEITGVDQTVTAQEQTEAHNSAN